MMRSLVFLAQLWLCRSQTCWAGFPDGRSFVPGMLVLPMGQDECTTTTTGTMTATTMTVTTSTSSTATVTATSVTATATTTTSITATTVTTTSVTATSVTTTATTVTTTSVTATTATTTSVTATTATTTSVTATTATTTATTVTTTSVTATTVTTTSVTATTATTTATTVTTTSVTATTVTTTSVTATTATTTATTVTTTSVTATSVTATVTTLTTTSATATATTKTATTTTSVTSTATTTTTLVLTCVTPFEQSADGEEFSQLNRAASSSCDGLSQSSFCSMTFGTGSAGALSECVVAGSYQWFCPKNLVSQQLYAAEAYIQCRACSGSYVDTDDMLGEYKGMLTFGPNMKNGSVDESFVDVYLVYPVDDCGHIEKGASPLVTVAKSTPNAECCEHSKYSVELNITSTTFTKIVVVPGATTGGVTSHLDDGLVIDLVDLTTTSTTTNTVTVTMTTSMTTTMTMFDDGAALSGSTQLRFAFGSLMALALVLA
ncbi:unnamed protein product [Effrenium voratum]|uniref:Uncharacterized protein n=1 Tax=Effrenium voratum TaxID=2562239 RepID=A0AA36I6G3_9DINO|nr:unnamed protein product [Effrenium voratum]CAJ1432946.1 unnamed protein product [Effrenium voratum]